MVALWVGVYGVSPLNRVLGRTFRAMFSHLARRFTPAGHSWNGSCFDWEYSPAVMGNVVKLNVGKPRHN